METFKSLEAELNELNGHNTEIIALKVFEFQSENNPVYRSFITHTGRPRVTSLAEIPFLPIAFFKSHDVKSGTWVPEEIFLSSGTGGPLTSRHLVRDAAAYLRNTEKIFNSFFGSLKDYHVLALLPSYLERDGSSLVMMADHFIRQSHSVHSGFYLNEPEALLKKLEELRGNTRKTLLLGVSFALLELAEKYSPDLSHCIIMETGGMKGRRKEIVREDLHAFLSARFNVPLIMSEYGMTELFSQAYSQGKGRFQIPSTMRILVRDVNDPFKLEPAGKTGGLNIIDLANINTCSFIETEDLGRLNQDGSFEVLGRLDNSDVRGCNLLVG